MAERYYSRTGWARVGFRSGFSPKRNCPGCGFARPEIANSTYAKTFYPHGLRPWDWEWEEPVWHHARFAIVMPYREKAAGLCPAPSWGEPVVFYLVAMGTTARPKPRLTHCSWPQTPLVWLATCQTPRNLGSYPKTSSRCCPYCPTEIAGNDAKPCTTQPRTPPASRKCWVVSC